MVECLNETAFTRTAAEVECELIAEFLSDIVFALECKLIAEFLSDIVFALECKLIAESGGDASVVELVVGAGVVEV